MGRDTERRRHPRFEIPVRVYGELGGTVVRYTTRDVSLGGAFLLTGDDLPVGRRLTMFLDVPSDDDMRPGCEIEVVRVSDDGVGVRFVDPPGAFLSLLSDEIERLKRRERD